MNLDAQQEDALKEIINIGYGRAAAALSEMTGARILLDAPQVSLLRLDQMQPELNRLFSTEVACVSQSFSGPIAGNAVLLLDDRSAALLARLVTRDDQAEMGEVVTEVANVVLGACLGVFGNVLQMQIAFTLPKIRVAAIDSLFRSISIRGEFLSHALLVNTRFSIKNSNVKGYMGIVLGIDSIERLFHAIDNWADN